MELAIGIIIGLCYGIFLYRQQLHFTKTYKRYYQEIGKDLIFWREMYCKGENALTFYEWARNFTYQQNKENKWLPEKEQKYFSAKELYDKWLNTMSEKPQHNK